MPLNFKKVYFEVWISKLSVKKASIFSSASHVLCGNCTILLW